jgi:hypothetical protein
MPVKYLSQEWIDAYNAALTEDDAVRCAGWGRRERRYSRPSRRSAAGGGEPGTR